MPAMLRTNQLFFVRVGCMGQVGRFSSAEALRYPRGSRVIVRTARGLELGEVLALPEGDESPAEADGTILRGMTVEDQLLEARLVQNRHRAFGDCQRRLAELGIDSLLVDVELLFDGQSLYFYFLGEVPPRLDTITAQLAEAYEARVQFRRFAEAMTAGCGPGCGTEAAEGHGCGSCATGGAVSQACGTRGGAADR